MPLVLISEAVTVSEIRSLVAKFLAVKVPEHFAGGEDDAPDAYATKLIKRVTMAVTTSVQLGQVDDRCELEETVAQIIKDTMADLNDSKKKG